MAAVEASERRTSPRAARTGPVEVRPVGSDEDPATGRTVNISRGGIRLELEGNLPLRSAVRLSLPLGGDALSVRGTVVYLEVLDARRCCTGIQFTDLDAGGLERLDRFLATGGQRG